MNIAITIITIIYAIIGVAISAVILLQQGNTSGLGSISGMADSYWGKNKGRSMEGNLEKATRIGAAIFIILAFVLNLLMR